MIKHWFIEAKKSHDNRKQMIHDVFRSANIITKINKLLEEMFETDWNKFLSLHPSPLLNKD